MTKIHLELPSSFVGGVLKPLILTGMVFLAPMLKYSSFKGIGV